jgi:hypothetical protein
MDHGATVLFWNETLLSDKLPRLYSYARDKTISGAKFLTQENILTHFRLPLSLQAYQELSKLQSFIQQIQMPQNPGKDIWHYQWGNSYTSTKLYHFPYRNFHPPKPFIWIWLWDSKCSNKLRVFVWLLLMDRLNTSLLKRKKNQSTRQQLRLCSMLRQPRRNSPPPLLCMPLQLRMLATFTNQVGHTPELLRNGLSKNKHHSPVHGIHNYCGMPHMVTPAVFSKNTSTENALPQHGITS